jgi:hypothetical protein
MGGYHATDIKPGVFGEASKVREEFEEFWDAHCYGYRVMELCELADLLGAIEGYVNKHYPQLCMRDILAMKDLTKNAFESGHRTPKPAAVEKVDFGACRGCGVNCGGTKPFWCEHCTPSISDENWK